MYQLIDWDEYEDGDENEDGLWEEDENSDSEMADYYGG